MEELEIGRHQGKTDRGMPRKRLYEDIRQYGEWTELVVGNEGGLYPAVESSRCP